MITLDLKGLSCPEPLVKTQMAVKKSNGEDVCVIVDDKHALENIQRYAKKQKLQVEVTEEGGAWSMRLFA